MESSNTIGILIGSIVVLLIWFIWYYVTLPGSYLSYNKNNYVKPPIKAAFKQYFGIYLIPFFIWILYLVYLARNNPNFGILLIKCGNGYRELVRGGTITN